jgi:hypothetical protein
MHKHTLDIEADDGPLYQPIPARELGAVRGMNKTERRVWLDTQVRKRRNKNKAARKARRRGRS